MADNQSGGPLIRKASSMMYPLEVPNGWFLAVCAHRHVLEGTSHWVPAQLSEGAWFVTFQKTTQISSVVGTGHTMEEAWNKATEMANG